MEDAVAQQGLRYDIHVAYSAVLVLGFFVSIFSKCVVTVEAHNVTDVTEWATPTSYTDFL